eukprot:gene19968-23891_t
MQAYYYVVIRPGQQSGSRRESFAHVFGPVSKNSTGKYCILEIFRYDRLKPLVPARFSGFFASLFALVPVTILYILLSFSIAELATSIPEAGGPYIFALEAFGRFAAFLTGLAETIKVVVTGAVIVVGIGSYLSEILGTDEKYQPLWWLTFYTCFVGLNVVGVAVSFRFQLLATLLAILLLVIFYAGATPHLDIQRYAYDPADPWPHSFGAVIKALPFALWFYLGIEELPLATEEALDPFRDMPRALGLSFMTLVSLALLTTVLSSSIPPGAEALAVDQYPLLTGYRVAFGDTKATNFFCVLLVMGL